MKVRDILARKGTAVITIGQGASLHEAVSLLNEHRIGVVLVTDVEDSPVGILSERDVVTIMAAEGCNLNDKLVSDAMTADLIVCVPDDELNYVMSVMTQRRVRHLPILDKGRLVGIICESDLLKAEPSAATTLSVYEIHSLLAQLRLKEIMVSPVFTVEEQCPLEEAARILRENRITGLPVMRLLTRASRITYSPVTHSCPTPSAPQIWPFDLWKSPASESMLPPASSL